MRSPMGRVRRGDADGKSYLFLLAFVLACMTVMAADQYCEEQNVEVVNGVIQLARPWVSLFSDDFEMGFDQWTIYRNYEDKLTIGVFGEGQVGQCLDIRNVTSSGDTYFDVRSIPFDVQSGASYRFQFSLRSNLGIVTQIGPGWRYMTKLIWYDASGTTLDPTQFDSGPAMIEWRSRSFTGLVPSNAVRAKVCFSFDYPNLKSNEFVAVDTIGFEQHAEPAVFQTSGSILSRPIYVGSGGYDISSQVNVPAGTTVRLSVAGALDEGGGPGGWSEWFDAKALPSVLTNMPWVRYRANLETVDSAKTPTLELVTIGNTTDGPWQRLDIDPPVLVECSPKRTASAEAPIWFRLADETGVDLKTVNVTLDGSNITDEIIFDNGEYVYQPPAALQPLHAEIEMWEWRLNKNYNDALTITRTASRNPGGPSGFHITRLGDNIDTYYWIQSPPIVITPGAHYTLKYWTRHSVTATSAGKMIWMGTNGVVGGPLTIAFGGANTNWHQDTYDLSAPDEARSALVYFSLDSPNLYNGAFVDIAEFELEGSRPDSNPNLHHITLSAADFANNVLECDWYLLIRPLRKKGVVSIRDDGMTLVDGQPFFPIGLYSVWKNSFNSNNFDKAFGDLKAAGFNLAHTYGRTRGLDFSTFYASAQRHGMKVMVPSAEGANCLDVETVLRDVVQEEGQPSLLAWYLADDTASYVRYGEYDGLRRLTDAIHNIDPAHITMQADPVGTPSLSRYLEFVNSTDGFLPELYPIRDETDKCVPQIVTDMKTVQSDLARAAQRPKTIWALVQSFKGWDKWPRYPTRQELWAMSYLSLIRGAHGILWYTYASSSGDGSGVADSPEAWQNICELASELSKLQDVFVERTGPQPSPPYIISGPTNDALGYRSISILLKERGGTNYLFAANSANADVSASFVAEAGKTITLPFENRQLLTDDSGFTDTFAPYGVHVYTWVPTRVQPAMTVFTVDGLTRVRPFDPPQFTTNVVIEAARNEYEPFQVVVRAGSNGLSHVNVEISDLQSESGQVIDRQNIKLFREHYISVTNPSPKSIEGVGLYPDALIPFLNPIDGKPVTSARFIAAPFDVLPNANQPVWVDVYVPEEARAGNYTGTLMVSAADQSAIVIPIQLTVWNFTLPDTPSMRSNFGGLGDRLAIGYDVDPNSAEFIAIERRYAEAMAAHRLCPPIPSRLMPTVGTDGRIDPTSTHAPLKDWIETFRLTGIDLGEKSLQTNGYSANYLQSMYAYLTSNRWEKLAYISVFDDPNNAADYDLVRQRAQFVHAVQPGMKILCTEQPTPQDPAWGTLVESVDIWAPLWTLFEEQAGIERLAAGEELWSYTTRCPGSGLNAPYWEIDFPLLNYRIPAWISWRYGMTGLLYWSTIFWEQAGDVWTNMLTYNSMYNGEGALFYPGTDAGFAGPVVSMRLKQIREGLEDYEYFVLLAKRGEKALADEYSRRLAESWTEWDENHTHLYELREQIAQRLYRRGPREPTNLRKINDLL